MPFASGTVGCVVYRVTESLPEDFHERAQRGLSRYRFRPIDDAKGEDRSSGWANPLSLLAPELRVEQMLLGDYLYLGVRIDRKSPNRAVLNARVQDLMAARLRDASRKRLSADERNAIKSEARRKLLAETSASTMAHEVLWNIDAGWLFFSSQSPTANNELLDLFASSFELDIVPMLPYTYSETWADEKGLLDELESIEPGVLCRPRKPRAVPDSWEAAPAPAQS
jgi:DNA recombination-dependent growth factor C